MNKLLLTILGTLGFICSASVSAACSSIGSNYISCTDGTSYQKFGNSIYGSNYKTGSTWSQTQIGNTTYGLTNGRSWSLTRTPYSIYGINSRGNSYYYSIR